MENIMYQVSTLQALILGYSRTVINVGEEVLEILDNVAADR